MHGSGADGPLFSCDMVVAGVVAVDLVAAGGAVRMGFVRSRQMIVRGRGSLLGRLVWWLGALG